MCVAVVVGAVFATRLFGDDSAGTSLVVVLVDPEGGLEMASNKRGELPIRRRRGGTADTQLGVPVSWAWPCLWAFLTAVEWSPGDSRVLGTVTLYLDGGKLKVCFNDKDAGEVGFATLDPDLPVLDAVERCLREDRVDWRRPKAPDRKR